MYIQKLYSRMLSLAALFGFAIYVQGSAFAQFICTSSDPLPMFNSLVPDIKADVHDNSRFLSKDGSGACRRNIRLFHVPSMLRTDILRFEPLDILETPLNLGIELNRPGNKAGTALYQQEVFRTPSAGPAEPLILSLDFRVTDKVTISPFYMTNVGELNRKTNYLDGFFGLRFRFQFSP